MRRFCCQPDGSSRKIIEKRKEYLVRERQEHRRQVFQQKNQFEMEAIWQLPLKAFARAKLVCGNSRLKNKQQIADSLAANCVSRGIFTSFHFTPY